eukprot:CAMPEP_0185204372 /NCGR_PEP_ID=MMETSP1140-20130426/54737_1 /TAXON_ID=298111 /ORGANISM="Pavlova sp., Strain CCMP459" /LENGTH=70 /DNA_ID=CAMNT_0027771919 /DNA_START=48 /DNA_END=257 /DNA_ORIENTATION=+
MTDDTSGNATRQPRQLTTVAWSAHDVQYEYATQHMQSRTISEASCVMVSSTLDVLRWRHCLDTTETLKPL